MRGSPRSLRVRSALLTTVVIGLALAMVWPPGGRPPARAAAGAPAQVGSWTKPFDVGIVGVHATLLHTGKVLLVFWPHGGIANSDGTGSQAKLWNPATNAVTDVPIPWAYDAFCGGHAVLSDGRVFVSGGTKYGASVYDATKQTALFDPVSAQWTAGPNMANARWYPSDLELANGKVLIFSGWSQNEGPVVPQVESYDPASNTINALPASANFNVRLYPRVMLLPNGNVLDAGPFASTRELDTKTWTWSDLATTAGGDRFAGSTVLLPGEKTVLALGGEPGTNNAMRTAEVLDLSQTHPSWKAIEPMHHARLYANPVLLPDGNVLVVGGGAHAPFTGPVKSAEMFDTKTRTWTEMASQAASRIYHSTALLLPDGRVMSAGQNDGPLQTTVEIYSPPYLFAGPRPTISSAPTSASYGSSINVESPDANSIARVALVRPGSVTHSVNFDQRYVRLGFTRSGNTLTARIPSKAAAAPPGWYMLFVANSSGVPSVASWVRVT